MAEVGGLGLVKATMGLKKERISEIFGEGGELKERSLGERRGKGND